MIVLIYQLNRGAQLRDFRREWHEAAMQHSEQFSPKTQLARAPLPGSIHAEWIRCGKPGCHCAHGELHGPYWRRYWREAGRTHKAYVRLEEADQIRAATRL